MQKNIGVENVIGEHVRAQQLHIELRNFHTGNQLWEMIILRNRITYTFFQCAQGGPDVTIQSRHNKKTLSMKLLSTEYLHQEIFSTFPVQLQATLDKLCSQLTLGSISATVRLMQFPRSKMPLSLLYLDLFRSKRSWIVENQFPQCGLHIILGNLNTCLLSHYSPWKANLMKFPLVGHSSVIYRR